MNTTFLSFLNNFLKSYYLNPTIIQSIIYIYYIEYFNNTLFNWFFFIILNIAFLNFKYTFINLIANYNLISFKLIVKKIVITIILCSIYILFNK